MGQRCCRSPLGTITKSACRAEIQPFSTKFLRFQAIAAQGSDLCWHKPFSPTSRECAKSIEVYLRANFRSRRTRVSHMTRTINVAKKPDPRGLKMRHGRCTNWLLQYTQNNEAKFERYDLECASCAALLRGIIAGSASPSFVMENVRSWEWQRLPRREPREARERLGPLKPISRQPKP